MSNAEDKGKEKELADLIANQVVIEDDEDENAKGDTNREADLIDGDPDGGVEDESSETEMTKTKDDPPDDLVDEEKIKKEEETLTEEQLNERHNEAKQFKEQGNVEYANEDYRGSILSYTKALLICPLKEKELRAVLFSNRSASKVKLERKELAIDDCSSSLTHNPTYMKPLIRRAKLYEETDKLDEALADYQKILELDPSNRDARYATQRLPGQINERNERLKTEMMGKLKDLGNMVLRPFGLSTENFQLQQDPNSGGYSINFKK